LLFVVRPLVRRIVTPEENALEIELDGEKVLLGKDEEGRPVLTGPDGKPLEGGDALALEDKRNGTAEIIQSARINGEIQASAVQEIGSIVEAGPLDAVAVLRQWMEEDETSRKTEAAA
jgi:flagellar M-ring protein FliF